MEIARFLAESTALAECAIDPERLLEIIASSANAGTKDGKQRIWQTTYKVPHTLWSEGDAIAHRGIFMVSAGTAQVSRRVRLEKIQKKLLLTGAIEAAQNSSLRQVRSATHDVPLAERTKGDVLGDEIFLKAENHSETVTVAAHTSVVFVPEELFFPAGRLAKAGPVLSKVAKQRASSRGARFAHLIEGLDTGSNHRQTERHNAEMQRQTLNYALFNKKPTERKGAAVEKARVHKGSSRRFFRHGGLVFCQGQGFAAGDVPVIDPYVGKGKRAGQALAFVQIRETFRAPSGALPPPSDLPATRVGNMYQRLWDNCSHETMQMLQELQAAAEPPRRISPEPSPGSDFLGSLYGRGQRQPFAPREYPSENRGAGSSPRRDIQSAPAARPAAQHFANHASKATDAAQPATHPYAFAPTVTLSTRIAGMGGESPRSAGPGVAGTLLQVPAIDLQFLKGSEHVFSPRPSTAGAGNT
ncbi:hypothetical protein T484DRAFT_1777777 [Baffinella frigidus]|nr:hypothetical protein T484DRAFT_1777777 [Cryptophyta sp. CCMP2293]